VESSITDKNRETGTENVFPADMVRLIERVKLFLSAQDKASCRIRRTQGRDSLADTFGFSSKGKGDTAIVLAEDTAVELGHPSTVSLSMVLITEDATNINDNRITVVGPEVRDMDDRNRYPFAQVIMLAVDYDTPPDPFEIDSLQYLTNRLPGYMVRSVPGKLWARISRKGIEAGIDLSVIGSAAINAYQHELKNVKAAEVLYVTSSKEDIAELEQVKVEADILSGRHKKLVLGIDGELECTESNCTTCAERPICDSLRDIVIKRRKMKPRKQTT
jgi:CO dehydrogenase/acetyl-CoA synthase beta subunit